MPVDNTNPFTIPYSMNGLPQPYTIEGSINGNGTITKGSGFTVQRIGIGAYIVQFDHPFFYQSPQISIEVSGFVQGGVSKIIVSSLDGFKYFTIEQKIDSMYLKDYSINFSANGIKN